MLQKVIVLDFDGTLCERAWPGIGAPKWPIIRAALEEQRQGALLILWTTREGEALDEALTWCKDVGLNLDGVNTSAQSWKDVYQNDPRKIGATEYWDDRAVDVAIIETRHMLAHLDAALDELEKETRQKGRAYMFDAYRARYMEGLTAEEVAEKLNAGKNSPARWCKQLNERLAVLLFGVDGLRRW